MTSPALRPHDQLTHDEFTAISKAVHEFESLWRQTRNPAIEPFLPEASDPLRLRLLIELLRIDQEHRWERGERRLLEQYLQDWPELIAQPAAIQELLDAECLTRFCLEDSPTRDELRQRFPQFAEAVDLDRLRGIALAEKGEASTAKGVNEATLITIKPPQVGDNNVDRSLRDRKEFESRSDSPTLDPTKSETSAVLAARRIGLLTGKQFGRYEVRRLVGTGGMGAVYEARDTQLDRIVALKIPRSELVNDPVILQRFLNEARAAGAIRHPHICPIYDVGQLDGQHFITMPLVQGMTLAAWMEHRTVSLHEATELTRKLASALQAIHAAGIRHRDIKASNVMIDERGEPLLMDFGLARLAQTDQHLTQSGSLVGTPAYMAPEQIQLGASGGDERSDVYSLGVLLYQMLSGRLPFEGPMTRVLVDIATKDAPRLETLRPDVDAALADICRKAMSREPSNRYQTAAEFESALESCVRRLGTLARPESTKSTTAPSESLAPQRTGKSAHPPRRMLTAIAAAFFFALAVIVIKISDRAELIIKTSDPDVEVSVRQLAQPEQDFTLTVGEKSVRVRSGNVEVVLTGANADQYEVRNNGVVMKRFGREVVEITRRESVVGRPSQADSSRAGNAKVGQGRPTYVAARSVWDDLDPKTIPESERVPGQPQELVAVLGAHRQRHWSMLHSVVIRADGKQAATCAGDGIRFWDLQTFQEQAHLNSTNTPGLPLGSPLSLLYTPDGRTLLVGHASDWSGSDKSTVSQIDVSVLPPRLVHSWKLPNGWNFNTYVLEMSSSGRFLSGRFNNGIGFLVERTETEFKAVSDFPDVERISFAPDEKTVSVATRTGGPLRLFGFQDSKLTEQAVLTGSANEPEQPQSPFRDAKFSPDGRLLVIDGKSIPWFWDVSSAEPKPLFKLSRTGVLPSFSKDGQSLLGRNADGGNELHLWAITENQAKLVFSFNGNALPRHSAAITNDNILGADLSPDGKFAITGHLNGIVRFLDVSSPDVTELHPVKPNPAISVSYARPLRIGTDALAIMSEDMPHAREWKLKDGQLHRMSMVENGFDRTLATSTDGSVLVNFESSPKRCVIRRREQNEWRTVRTIPSTIETISGALSHDQRRLVIGSNSGEIELWDLEAKSPRKLWANRTPENHPVIRLHFAMNDRLLVSQIYSVHAVVQRISDTGLEPVLTSPRVNDLALDVAPNGESLAVVSNNSVAVWSLTDDPPQVVSNLSAPQNVAPRSVNYSPDGRQLAVAHDNGQILLHDLESGTVARKLQLPGQISHVLFTTDNRHLITANANGTIYVLRLAPPKETPK